MTLRLFCSEKLLEVYNAQEAEVSDSYRRERKIGKASRWSVECTLEASQEDRQEAQAIGIGRALRTRVKLR